jgi:hypothetical protein
LLTSIGRKKGARDDNNQEKKNMAKTDIKLIKPLESYTGVADGEVVARATAVQTRAMRTFQTRRSIWRP